jgi:hypothetical protein
LATRQARQDGNQTKSESPLGWFNLAHAYLFDAATLYKAEGRPRRWHYEAPVHFLYFHAIELFLKAYLRTQGMTDQELSQREYGHKLKNLIDEAEARGMPITKRINRVRLFQMADEAKDQPIRSRYLRTGSATILPVVRLHEAARDLQVIVESALHRAGIATQRLPQLPIVHPQERPLTLANAARLLARKP